ncbi:MAG: substrate-binding domain-containing protein, partial [Clostridia bacterium]|nr:substrate-binding domain-containing protein [Clostridia bacterium]
PIVTISSFEKKAEYLFDSVCTDRGWGIRQAVAHLKEMGHKRIGFLGEYLTRHTCTAFREALRSLDLEIHEDRIVSSPKRKAEAGFDGADLILSRGECPDAVFCAYDAIAFGAISRFHQSGLSVPEDISVISYNDIPLARFATPPLTTISTPVEATTDAALNLLYKRMQNPLSPRQSVTLSCDLVLRDSVKKRL